jgi:hypothetical protein
MTRLFTPFGNQAVILTPPRKNLSHRCYRMAVFLFEQLTQFSYLVLIKQNEMFDFSFLSLHLAIYYLGVYLIFFELPNLQQHNSDMLSGISKRKTKKLQE